MTSSRPAHEAMRVILRERMTVIPRCCRHRQSRWVGLRQTSDTSSPEHLSDINQLLYGEGDLDIHESPIGTFAGQLNLGADYRLGLKGSISYGWPFIVRFQGAGIAGGKADGWVYDYVGFVIPMWPHGIDQRPAIVGSNIRTVPHDGASAPAGLVASWIAIKQVTSERD